MDYHRSDIAGAENYFTRVLSNADPKPLDRDYPKWRTDATMWLQFRANFASRYIEMHMRRVHLTMHTEGITAFSSRYGVVVWTGENDTKTISVDAFLF